MYKFNYKIRLNLKLNLGVDKYIILGTFIQQSKMIRGATEIKNPIEFLEALRADKVTVKFEGDPRAAKSNTFYYKFVTQYNGKIGDTLKISKIPIAYPLKALEADESGKIASKLTPAMQLKYMDEVTREIITLHTALVERELMSKVKGYNAKTQVTGIKTVHGPQSAKAGEPCDPQISIYIYNNNKGPGTGMPIFDLSKPKVGNAWPRLIIDGVQPKIDTAWQAFQVGAKISGYITMNQFLKHTMGFSHLYEMGQILLVPSYSNVDTSAHDEFEGEIPESSIENAVEINPIAGTTTTSSSTTNDNVFDD